MLSRRVGEVSGQGAGGIAVGFENARLCTDFRATFDEEDEKNKKTKIKKQKNITYNCDERYRADKRRTREGVAAAEGRKPCSE